MSGYRWIYTCSFYVLVTNELEVYLLNYCPNGCKRFFDMVQSPESFFELTLNEIKQIDNINKMLWSESQPNLGLFLRASQIYFVTVKFYCWFTDFFKFYIKNSEWSAFQCLHTAPEDIAVSWCYWDTVVLCPTTVVTNALTGIVTPAADLSQLILLVELGFSTTANEAVKNIQIKSQLRSGLTVSLANLRL